MSNEFDLKYRPKTFNDVLGNVGVVKLLKNRSVNGSLANRSMMFGGQKGSGKTSLARIVAKAISCVEIKSDGSPCLECEGCISVDNKSSDIYDEFDAATQGTVDKMREILRDVEYGTFSGKPRIIVLDEAHRLTKQAQDALLLPMEDRRLVIILCTTEPHAIRSAIRDRVEEYSISHPSRDAVMTRLKEVCKNESIKYEEDALDLLIQVNASNPRTCLTGLQSTSILGKITIESIKEIYRFGSKDKIVRVLELLDCNLKGALDEIEELFRYEGPIWVRDEIVGAISLAIRAASGSKNAGTPRAFYSIRGLRWADLAKDLAMLDRPDPADIECVLLSSVKSPSTWLDQKMPQTFQPKTRTESIPFTPITELRMGDQPTSNTPNPAWHGDRPMCPVDAAKTEEPIYIPTFTTTEPYKEPVMTITVVDPNLSGGTKLASETKTVVPVVKKIEPVKNKPLEIDGVLFTVEERLTTLDGKIPKGSSKPPSADDEKPPLGKIDPNLALIPESEFAYEFLKGFKK